MKHFSIAFLFLIFSSIAFAQEAKPTELQRKNISKVIDQYLQARTLTDTVLLKKILAKDIDQLVSTGEWRRGVAAAVEGMIKSSRNEQGNRTLTIDRVRLLTPSSALVDCRYEITNADGTPRKMWSSFIFIEKNGAWKIAAIRNMLPSVH